jgi:protein gp37
MENSQISWTDNTFNGWGGCTKCCPACSIPYPSILAARRCRRTVSPQGKFIKLPAKAADKSTK